MLYSALKYEQPTLQKSFEQKYFQLIQFSFWR